MKIKDIINLIPCFFGMHKWKYVRVNNRIYKYCDICGETIINK